MSLLLRNLHYISLRIDVAGQSGAPILKQLISQMLATIMDLAPNQHAISLLGEEESTRLVFPRG